MTLSNTHHQTHRTKVIPFNRYSNAYLLISGIVIGLGLFFILQYGYQFSVDFTGGARIKYQLTPQNEGEEINISKEYDTYRDTITAYANEQNIELRSVEMRENDTLYIRTAPINESQQDKLAKHIGTSHNAQVSLLQFETVGATIGKETVHKTVVATIVAILGIMAYIAYSFRNTQFAFAAIIALVHDILVVLGMYAGIGHFLGAEFDALFVTALLTTMSFSVHDTIVIFDKVREYRRTHAQQPVEEQVNRALTDTIRRSMYNSFTTFLMLFSLLVIGGSTIRFFVMALLLGIITGAYSSPFVAAPVLTQLLKRMKHTKNTST